MAKQTLTSRVDALEALMVETAKQTLANGESLAAILAHFEGKAPAKTVTRKPAARKAPAKRAPKAAAAAPLQVKALCKSTRTAFVAAAAANGVRFEGLSTKVIAAMCIEDPSLVPAGFRIGEGYQALLGA